MLLKKKSDELQFMLLQYIKKLFKKINKITVILYPKYLK